MPEFVIKVLELEAGGKQYDFPITPAWVESSVVADRGDHDIALRPHGTGSLSVFAEKAGEDVLVRGRLKGSFLAECSRCLADAPIPVDIALTALFTARRAEIRQVADSDDLTPEEIDKEFFSGDTITLDEIVRENMLLEVPMQPLCKESCPGLEIPEAIRGPADLSGAPLHEGKKIDPRLAPLLAIMGKGEAQTGPETPNAKPGTKKKPKGSN